MQRCALYRRVSGKVQLDGASLEEQDLALRAYATERGWEIVADYYEAASSWKGTRDEFDRMIEDARARSFRYVLVWALDRFARRFGEIHSVTEELEALGIHLILVKDGVDLCDGSITATVIKSALAMAAYLENVARSDRSKMSAAHRRSLRLFHSSLPTGYVYAGKYQPAAIDEEKAAGIRKAFTLYATGEYSIVQLCSQLNDEGHRNKHGKRFTYRSLHQILINRSYTGLLPDEHGRWVESNEVALISEDLFERVQSVITEHARSPRSHSQKLRSTYLLKGLVYCTACRRKMYAQFDDRARYKDSSYFTGQPCPASQYVERGVMIKEEILVPQVETLVTSFTLLPAWRDRVRDILASRDERRAIETQRRAIEARLERKRIVYEEGDIDLVTYRAERDDLRRQLDALVVPREQRILDAGQFVEEMAGIWREATLQERHAMLKAIFAKVWVDRVTQSVVGVEVHPDFVPVFRQLPGLREEGGIFYVEGVQEKAAMGVRELVV